MKQQASVAALGFQATIDCAQRIEHLARKGPPIATTKCSASALARFVMTITVPPRAGSGFIARSFDSGAAVRTEQIASVTTLRCGLHRMAIAGTSRPRVTSREIRETSAADRGDERLDRDDVAFAHLALDAPELAVSHRIRPRPAPDPPSGRIMIDRAMVTQLLPAQGNSRLQRAHSIGDGGSRARARPGFRSSAAGPRAEPAEKITRADDQGRAELVEPYRHLAQHTGSALGNRLCGTEQAALRTRRARRRAADR